MKYVNASVFVTAVSVLGLLNPLGVGAQEGSLQDKYGAFEKVQAPSKNKPQQSSSNPSLQQASPSGQKSVVVAVDPNAQEGEEVTANEEDLISLNAVDIDIKDLIKLISKATNTNFLIEDKIRGKITIISEKRMTKGMAYQAFLSALEVMGYTTVPTPGGLIKIVQTKSAVTEPIDFYKFSDKMPYTDRFITRIIQVKNISANELATVVKSLVSKEGNLFAYPATNSLILTDNGSNIDRILKIVKELDQEGPQEVIEIIPIRHADASDITEKVLQLFEKDAQKKGRRTRRSRRRGAELEEAPSINKVISDQRTNSVIILGSKRAIVKVRALIARLDSAISGVEGTIHVYYLKHANAKEMADVLASLVSDAKKKSGKSSRKDANKTSGAILLEGGVRVTADESTNSLVITASPKDYQTLVDTVVRKLDIQRPQVYLEAVVLELSVEKTRTIGINGNFGQIFGLFGEDITGFGSVLPTAPTSIASIAGATGGLAGGAFSNRTIDLDLGGGETVSIPGISLILQALQSDTDVNILSTPSILTLDNEEAQIQIGQEVPTPSGTTVSSGVTTFNVTREDTGIILKITPQISESDTIRLKMSQEVTNVIGSDPNLGPTLTKRKVDTVVVAHDNQTVVIGGLIDDQASVTSHKVPLLGDIPIVGNLFKNKTSVKRKNNILVFVTPYIIRERSDYMAVLKKKMEERNHFIDLNYGKSQKKLIRNSLKNHASELLHYKNDVWQSQQKSSSFKSSEKSSHQFQTQPAARVARQGSSKHRNMTSSYQAQKKAQETKPDLNTVDLDWSESEASAPKLVMKPMQAEDKQEPSRFLPPSRRVKYRVK